MAHSSFPSEWFAKERGWLYQLKMTSCILCEAGNFLQLTLHSLLFGVSTAWVSVTPGARHKAKSQPRTAVVFVSPIPAVVLTIAVQLLGQTLCDIATWKVAQGAPGASFRSMIFQRVTDD